MDSSTLSELRDNAADHLTQGSPMPMQAVQDETIEHPAIDRRPIVALDSLTESQWRELVWRRFDMGSDRMDGMEDLIDNNTTMTRAVLDGTAEIRDIVVLARSFFAGLGKFANGCGKVWAVLRPIVQAGAVIAGAYVAIRGALWTFTHGGQPPTPK